MVAALLTPLRGRNDLRIDDLVHLAAELVPQLAGPQLRYKVTSIPDARTVRYYVQEGLVDPPHGAAGPAALYGYRHLLQLVLVKVLQGHYLPIRQIRQTIEKLTDRELEKLLEAWRTKAPTPPAVSGPSTEALLASFHFGSEGRGSSPMPAAPTPDLPALQAPVDAVAGWTRHELYPGIELHVHDGAVIPPGSSFSSALASRMRVILERMAPDKRRKP